MRKRSSALTAAFRRVKLLLCDVDGVLTPGNVFMGGGGEFKEFSIQDGLGLRLLQKRGVKVGWVSARPSIATELRAADLEIDFLEQGPVPKVEGIEKILARAQLQWRDVCFIGDDVVDLGALRRAGLAVAVANAIDEVKAAAHYVTTAAGGQGAVREVAQRILKTQGHWREIVKEFSA